MTKTTVVNINKGQKCDIYIGRPSVWHNMYVASDYNMTVSKRHWIIKKYKDWIMAHPDLMKLAVVELKGKKLGCHCYPLPCHGDILVDIAEGKIKLEQSNDDNDDEGDNKTRKS